MKGLLIAAAVVLAAAVAWALWPRSPAGNQPAPPVAAPEAVAQRGKPAGSGSVTGFAGSALRDAVVQSGAPGSTPPLERAATVAEGFVDARVLAQGKPLEGAHVRLYFRGQVDRNTGVIDWRFAGAGETGRDGIAHLPARPGTYLAAARSGSFAPAHLEFQRPAGEKTTKIALELRRGIALSGRTVQKGSAD